MNSKRMQAKLFHGAFALLLLGCVIFIGQPANADNSLCATVKISISQELTLERQAFDAHMAITNGLSGISLEDVAIEVNFANEDGEAVLASSDSSNTDALFYIRIDTMENIDDVSGSGTVAPSTKADIHWLIIPAPGAANEVQDGTLYYVGATLTYTIAGEENVTEVTPDYIYVKPMPELMLDYFIPYEVYGDDAFTTEIEAPVPFNLGVRVSNNGFGTAYNLKIESAQPKIKENELGLLVGFEITGATVNGSATSSSLLVDFGDIAPDTSGAARWIMECSLSGKFTEFTADFTHSDELGGTLTSLLTGTDTHYLVHDVRVDLAGRDAVLDFLSVETPESGIYRVYESDNLTTDVANPTGALSCSGNACTLTTTATDGCMVVKVADPFDGEMKLYDVIRSDGKRIPESNAWLSKSRDENNDWHYYINLFDTNTTTSYTLRFEEPSADHAPVLQFIADQSRPEGQQVSFIVEASDPDGTIPMLSASPLPAGAGFIDQEDGSGVFDWTPAVGQAGQYVITFTASDGVLEDFQRVAVNIYSFEDNDGDGMPDAWELEHFGTLDRDGTGDYDGDGISDLDEYLNGTDPASSNAPGIPEISSPEDQAEVTTRQPDLVIQNSSDPDGDVITYTFEIYSDEGMSSLVASELNVSEAEETTPWTVPEALQDNHWYYWRARATDGVSFSQWAYGRFFVNTVNDAPGAFFISNPQDDSEVDTLTPVLEVTNSVDVDGDTLIYTYEVYSDESMITLVASVSGIAEGGSGSTSWMVDTELQDNVWYFWRSIAIDEHGASTACDLGSFFVNTFNDAPVAPTIISPADGGEIIVQDPDLIISNSMDVDGDTLTYFFELDKVNTFDSPSKQTAGPVQEGEDSTTWHASNLDDNTYYFWRVRANDGGADSEWTQGSFFVNLANDAPSIPTLKNPGQEAWVAAPVPTLEVNPSVDLDNDSLIYRFELYADAGLTQLVATADSDLPQWIPPELSDNTWYYWRAQSEDAYGATSDWMETASFFTDSNGINDPPTIVIQEPSEDFTANTETILISWEDSDPDSNARIALYYDTDAGGEDGILIVDGLEEDPDAESDSYLWDITGMADGTYYVYATIEDNTSFASSYGLGAIVVPSNIPPEAHAGDDMSIFVGEETGLDGSTSKDPDNGPEPLDFSWRFVDLPPESGLTDTDISGASTSYASFFPDVEGTYVLELMVSDGEDVASDQVVVTCVADVNDMDGDDMSDTWEMEYFGTLDRDGTDDFDGDGILDLDEYLNGTDPVSSNAPSIPEISSPENQAEVTTIQPDLVIQNSSDPDGDAITYTFEIYSDEGMSSLVASGLNVPEAEVTTPWTVPEALQDNHWYYWRARARDGVSFSQWAYGRFFINTVNEAPGEFFISNPQDDAEVDTLTPVLAVTNSVDVDGDEITCTFEVYADSSMSTLVASALYIPQGEGGTTSWTVDSPLDDNTRYFWKALAVDEHGAATQSPVASFFVNTENEAAEAPGVLSPAIGSGVEDQELDLIVNNAFDPDGDLLTYFFELDKVDTFDSEAKQTSNEISEGLDTTSWHVADLEDNTTFFWRAKASDGYAESPWAQGNFFVNTFNDAPSMPTLKNPGQGAWVETLTPKLALNPSVDIDNDSLNYQFEIYSDLPLTDLVVQGESEIPEWVVSSALNDNSWYFWRAQAEDEHGATSGWMGTASFFVNNNGVNDPPEITILEPSSNMITNGSDVTISWEDSDPDSNADIALYYDTDATGDDGIPIVDGLKEDPDGGSDAYIWNITEMADGTYYVYAIITDGTAFETSYGLGTITIDTTPPMVSATPAGGSYDIPQNVTLSVDEAAVIYYTMDGTEPTKDAPVYDSSIDVTDTTTLKFMAVDVAGNQGETITETYTIANISDLDGDEVPDDIDNCPETFNPDQTDTDGNGIGDACEVVPLIGDLNGDGCVDFSDYNTIIAEVRGLEPQNPEHDLNGDGIVNISDARFLVMKFTNPRGAACQ